MWYADYSRRPPFWCRLLWQCWKNAPPRQFENGRRKDNERMWLVMSSTSQGREEIRTPKDQSSFWCFATNTYWLFYLVLYILGKPIDNDVDDCETQEPRKSLASEFDGGILQNAMGVSTIIFLARGWYRYCSLLELPGRLTTWYLPTTHVDAAAWSFWRRQFRPKIPHNNIISTNFGFYPLFNVRPVIYCRIG